LSAAFLVVGGLLAASPTAQAQPAPADSTLPLQPDVVTGQLDNGLRYYIRPNDEPKDRLVLRLAVDAGSVLETDAQRGLAHFVEHMLFNGTERFEKQALVDFMERIGMQFGPDVNAYTSFDETVYKLTVPTDSAGLVSTSLDVMEDWASAATLSQEEIEKERGVVIEEWRARLQNAQGRMQDDILPKILYNMRHAERLPIGDTSVVKNAPPEEVRRFYKTWYRPNLMAVVAVGDVPPDSVEAMIRTRFADLENPAEATPRPTYGIADHEETQYAIATDPEFPVSLVSVYFKTTDDPLTTVADYREQLKKRLFYGMLNARLSERARSGTAPYLGAQAFEGSFVRAATIYGMRAQVPDDSVEAGLEALVTEAARARQHGFAATELVRQKRSLRERYASAYEDRTNIASDRLADEYVSLFLSGDAAPGIAYEYDLVQSTLPNITVADVNRFAERLLGDENRVVVVQMPEKEGVTPPTEADLAAVLNRVQQKEVAPYEDEATDLPLLAEAPSPADVTARDSLPDLGVTEMTLANGVRVVVKPTDFKKDEVRLAASSPGGLSQVPDSAYAQARHAAAVVQRSGVGAFTQTALQKKLAGVNASVSPSIGGTEEGFSGSASPEDLETLFQLVHLYATEPRADSSALVAYQRQQRAYLKNRASTPGAIFQDSLTAALYGDHPRVQPPTVAEIDALDRQELLDVYRERFADASDFTFTVVGNVLLDTLETYARTYLGTLPTTSRTDSVRDVQPDLPETAVTKDVRAGVGQRSRVVMLFHGPLEHTRTTRHRLQTLADVLSIRLREELREERSGVYGVGVNASTSGAPDPGYRLSVRFTCDPERARELIAATNAELDAVRQGKTSAEDIAKVKEQQRRSRETALEKNGFWTSALDFVYTTEGEDPSQILRYDELVDGITQASVTETATTYLNPERYVEAVLYPEDFAAESESSAAGK
jgi:zinc protease